MTPHQEVFCLLGIGTVFLILLSRMVTNSQRTVDAPIGMHTGLNSPNNPSDPALSLYRTAESLYDEEDYQAAAASAALLTGDRQNILLSTNASLILALCHFKLSEFHEASDAARDALELIGQCPERGAPELNYLELNLLLLLWNCSDQYETTRHGLLVQARRILETPPLAFESDYQKNLWSATIYHNLAIAEERLGNLDEATENYDLARSFWSTFPQDSPIFARRFNESIAGYIECGRRHLSRIYELNVDEPDGL